MPLSLIQLDDNEILPSVEDSFQNSVVSRKAEFFMLATYYWLLTTEIQT
jgi:hypothetical protein